MKRQQFSVGKKIEQGEAYNTRDLKCERYGRNDLRICIIWIHRSTLHLICVVLKVTRKGNHYGEPVSRGAVEVKEKS